jgi:pantoate--beta-alanine ligase
MKIIESTAAFQEWRKTLPQNTTIGLVPTMGALHEGHRSLIERSARENTHTVVTLFVNQVQFNQASDFEKYPKTWEQDLALCERAGTTVLFAPKSQSELYPDGYHYRVSENSFSKTLCGEFRPGHFDGVLTVVLKLLTLAKATQAYFGEKDHQQLTLIEGMKHAFFLDTEIVPCPTVRETSGLALSSRNRRLNEHELAIAPKLYEIISSAPTTGIAKEMLESQGFKVEYLVDQPLNSGIRRYVAAWLGEVRLIDNVKL